jgi:N-acetylmuramoyl-L-alanine amidase
VRTVVQAVAGGTASYVDAAELAAALRGSAVVRGDRARVTAAGVVLDIVDGLAFARVAGREVPTAVPARVAGGRGLIPLQAVVDALGTSAAFRYDAGARTLAVVAPDGPEVAAGDSAPPATVLPTIVGAPRTADRGVVPVPAAPEPTDAPSALEAAPAGRRRTVVVDAGHGGVDPGMRGVPVGGTPVVEKDVTLGLARALRTALAARGFDVVLTRDRDTLIPLAERGRIANARRGDLFVSLHVNAANPAWRNAASVRGFETYFLSEARTGEARDVAARENESVRFETASGPGGGDPLRFIVSDLAQNEYLRVSQRLAAAVQRRLGRVHPAPNRGVQQAGFKVLVTASMPAVLVEVGYGSNAADAAYITSAAGQRDMAEAIADAAVEHVRRYGGRTGGAAAAGATR